jgi:pyruvate dehydrogenase E2 component (dihydrolipoamide acetyltransferase)
MATDVLMPKLSDTMEEGKIIKWLKQPGDRVRSGDLLAEVETDKANMEIESFDEGVVSELKVQEGESVPVGSVIAVLGAEGEAKPASGDGKAAATKEPPAKEPPAEEPGRKEPPAKEPARKEPPPEAPPAKAARGEPKAAGTSRDAAAPKDEQAAEMGETTEAPPTARVPTETAPPASEARPAPADRSEGVKASPLARRIAAERGVDLRAVRGTGPGGRIVQKDVEGAGGAAPAREPATAARAATAPAAAGRRELSRTRKTTAKRMAEAKREIPHFYVSGDLAMDEAGRVQESLRALGGQFEHLTVTHLLVKACALALRRVPEMNASLDVDGVVVHEHVNIGIATATDEGLLVPVVHDADRISLGELVETSRAAIGRARAGKPSGQDLSGATFTISNLGMFPVSHFAAVVNPPQAAILAVGTMREVPVVRDGAVVPGRLMTVTLSCDHRVVDGALAGRFLAELKPLLEAPIALVV